MLETEILSCLALQYDWSEGRSMWWSEKYYLYSLVKDNEIIFCITYTSHSGVSYIKSAVMAANRYVDNDVMITLILIFKEISSLLAEWIQLPEYVYLYLYYSHITTCFKFLDIRKLYFFYLCKYDNLISIDGLHYSNYRYIIQTGSLITIRIRDVINMTKIYIFFLSPWWRELWHVQSEVMLVNKLTDIMYVTPVFFCSCVTLQLITVNLIICNLAF